MFTAIYRQTDIHTYILIDRQAGRQTDNKQTNQATRMKTFLPSPFGEGKNEQVQIMEKYIIYLR